MGGNADGDVSYLGNVLYLYASFFVAAFTTTTVGSLLQVRGALTYVIAPLVFCLSFVLLLAQYDYLYLD